MGQFRQYNIMVVCHNKNYISYSGRRHGSAITVAPFNVPFMVHVKMTQSLHFYRFHAIMCFSVTNFWNNFWNNNNIFR